MADPTPEELHKWAEASVPPPGLLASRDEMPWDPEFVEKVMTGFDGDLYWDGTAWVV